MEPGSLISEYYLTVSPAGMIIIDDTDMVVALKITQTMWTVTGINNLVRSRKLYDHGDNWRLVSYGTPTV